MSWIPSYKKPSSGGGGYTPPSWADGTDEEIVEALEKHYAGEVDLHDYWSVGDERVVSLSSMSSAGDNPHVAQDVVFVLSNVGGKYLDDGVTECCFQVDQKNSLKESDSMNYSNTNTGGWKDCKLRTWCNNTYYNAIPSTIRPIFKQFINQSGLGNYYTSGVVSTTDYFALRAEIEIFGTNTMSVADEGTQVKWYETSSNRIKLRNGSDYPWWERSPRSGYYWFCYVGYGGTTDAGSADDSNGVAPFGCI